MDFLFIIILYIKNIAFISLTLVLKDGSIF